MGGQSVLFSPFTAQEVNWAWTFKYCYIIYTHSIHASWWFISTEPDQCRYSRQSSLLCMLQNVKSILMLERNSFVVFVEVLFSCPRRCEACVLAPCKARQRPGLARGGAEHDRPRALLTAVNFKTAQMNFQIVDLQGIFSRFFSQLLICRSPCWDSS